MCFTSNYDDGLDAATLTREGTGSRTNTGMCKKERVGSSVTSKLRCGNTAKRTSRSTSKSRERPVPTMAISSIGANVSKPIPCSMGSRVRSCANNRGNVVGVSYSFKTPMSLKSTTSRPRVKEEEKSLVTSSYCTDIAMINDTRNVSMVSLTKTRSLRSRMRGNSPVRCAP